MLINSEAAMVIAFFAASASICWSVAYVLGKRIDARRDLTPSDEHGQRLTRIETAVDTIAIELERLGEAQRYATRVGDSAPPKPLAENYRVNTPH